MTPTAGQTVGPFFGFALPWPGGPDLVPPSSPGAVRLAGRVLDGADAPVPDALVEIWQADPHGHVAAAAGSLHRDPSGFTGFGRSATDNAGRYGFTTVRPGTGFFCVTVFARGLGHRLLTRAYLPGAADDALTASLPEARSRTLRAVADGSGLRFDIRLQGEAETVFLRFPGEPG